MLAEDQSALSSDVREALSHYSDLQGWGRLSSNPRSVAELHLLASSHVVDLEAITNVIRNDAGLTIQVLQLSARKFGKRAGNMATLSEVIVQLGLAELRKIAAEVTLTSGTQGCC